MDNTGLQGLLVEDFSGGLTDFIIGGAPNSAEVLDNYVVDENNDLVTRPGCEEKYGVRITTAVPQNIIDNQEEVLIAADKKILTVVAGVSTEVTSPQGHSVFVGGESDLKADSAYNNKHTLLVSDSFKSPQKVYKDEDGNFTCTTLGMPDVLEVKCKALANQIKSVYNAHRVDLTQHLVADSTNTITSADASDVDSLFTLVDELLAKIQLHLDDAALGSPVYHTATFDRDIEDIGAEGFESLYDQLVLIRTALNTHDNGDAVHTLQNVHQVAATYLSPTATAAGAGQNYVYGVYHQYRYMVEDVEFLERGPIHLFEATNVQVVTSGISLANLPVVASGALENWDDSDITKMIVRSTNGGSTLFEVTELANATTTYTDDLSDADLQLNDAAYTEGGVADDERPLPARHVLSVGDVVYWLGVKEGRRILGNRIKCSKPGAPYSSPGDFYTDVEDDLVGGGIAGGVPVVFLDRAFYRIEGYFDSVGRGGIAKRPISTRIGTVSYKSIVQTRDGLCFAGQDGFYWTDGYTYRKISPDINFTYKNLSDKNEIVGTYDALRNRVLWGVKVDANSEANDTIFVACLDYRTPKGGHPFYSWSGGLDPDNFTCSALAFVGDELLRADYRGYILRHDEDILTDAYVDTALDPDDWYTQTIFYDYTSVAFDFGNDQTRKWVSKINVNADNETSLSLDISTANDRSGVFVTLEPIIKLLNLEWGDAGLIWGDDDLRWNYNPAISEWRWMKASEQALRCMYKQVKFSNAYVEIDNSDILGPVSVDGTANTCTLLDYPTQDWIEDPVNYYISFDTDNYATEYKILGINAGVLTLLDGAATLTTDASANWKIYGYKKREIFNLLNFVLGYKTISMTQETVRSEA